jgi:predicted enzyme related to lactoylglutathione lyase
VTVTGPDFIALQVRDLDAAAAFYETVVGLTRAAVSPPHAVVFATTPTFALRDPLPGVDLTGVERPGLGVVIWLHDPESVALHAKLAEAGVTIAQEPFEGPFGTTFAFVDPEGYAITVHDRTQ